MILYYDMHILTCADTKLTKIDFEISSLSIELFLLKISMGSRLTYNLKVNETV